jgi:thiamine-phosphate pyrophosphorylase
VIPRLHLILDLAVLAITGRDPSTIATAAARGGVDAVHLRAPGQPAGEVLALARALRRSLPTTTMLLINDRLDIALASGADGVQLPGSGLPLNVARALAIRAGRADRSFLIGCSVRTPEAAREAEEGGADFALLGTVFASASHPGTPPSGEALVAAIRAATRLPLIAVGGITTATAPHALAAGANGVAAIRAIVEAPDVAETVATLRRAVDLALARVPQPSGLWPAAPPRLGMGKSRGNQPDSNKHGKDTSAMIRIRLNGKEHELECAMSVQAFLEQSGKLPRWVVVELRGEPLLRQQYAEAMIDDGDTIEIVAPFGGG